MRTLRLSFLALPILAVPSFGQQHTVGGTVVSPRTVVIGQPSVVTVAVSIPDPTVITGSVNLLRLDSIGNATIVGTFHDDGKDGDVAAGDGVFTYQATLSESAVGQIHFQVSAAFRGLLQRIRADVLPVFVQVPNAPGIALSGLSAELASGNITGALLRFLDSAKATAVLTGSSAATQQQLASAFSSAQLVTSSADLRVYSAPWIGPSGQVLSLEFSLGPDKNGNWVVVAW